MSCFCNPMFALEGHVIAGSSLTLGCSEWQARASNTYALSGPHWALGCSFFFFFFWTECVPDVYTWFLPSQSDSRKHSFAPTVLINLHLHDQGLIHALFTHAHSNRGVIQSLQSAFWRFTLSINLMKWQYWRLGMGPLMQLYRYSLPFVCILYYDDLKKCIQRDWERKQDPDVDRERPLQKGDHYLVHPTVTQSVWFVCLCVMVWGCVE